MNNLQKIFLMFLIGCIGLRSIFVIIAKYINIKYLKYLGLFALIPAIGFIYIYLTGTRKTGAEVFGKKIWWNNLRPIHSILYFLFAYNAIIGNKESWIYLLVDVVIGLTSFLLHHYMNGDFSKVFNV
jgi:hypothetical protein